VPDAVQAELKTLQLMISAHDVPLRDLMRARRESPGPSLFRLAPTVRTSVPASPQQFILCEADDGGAAGAAAIMTADLSSGNAETKPDGLPVPRGLLLPLQQQQLRQ